MTAVVMFSDGSHNVPGCACGSSCQFPCWQRVGIADACEACDCLPFHDPAPPYPPTPWHAEDAGPG